MWAEGMKKCIQDRSDCSTEQLQDNQINHPAYGMWRILLQEPVWNIFKDTSHIQQLSVGLVKREGLGINIAQGGNLVLSNSQVYEKTQTWLERGNWYSARRDEHRCFWYHILWFSWPPCFFPFWEEVIAVPAYEDLLFMLWPSAVLCGQLAKVSLCYLSHFLAPSKQIKSWTYEKEQKKGVMIRCFLTPGYNSLTGPIKISKLTCP